MEDELYEEIIGPNGKRRYVRINIQKLLKKGGGFNNFYQKNKEYVKKWKDVLVNRQLFEMWNALPPEEQKEWLYKADAFSKLFELTDTTNVYKDIIGPKYPPPTELCKLLTKCVSTRVYFDSEMAKLRLFFDESIEKEPGHPPVPSGGYPGGYQSSEWRNYQELYGVWSKKHILIQTFTNKVLEAWKSSDDVFVRKSLRNAVCETMTYNTLNNTTNEQIWSKTAKEWQESYDAFEHAYDMFCENSKITNPQMRVTNADVKDHLSRMWESMDIETQNTWNHSDTLPIRYRGVRGLDGDFREDFREDFRPDLNEDIDYTLPNRHRRVRGLDGDLAQEVQDEVHDDEVDEVHDDEVHDEVHDDEVHDDEVHDD